MKKYIFLLTVLLLIIFFSFNKNTSQTIYAQTATVPVPTDTPTPTDTPPNIGITLSIPSGSICLTDTQSIDFTVVPFDTSLVGQAYSITATDPAAPTGTYSVNSTLFAGGNTVTLALPPASDFNNGDNFVVTFSSAGLLFPIDYTENCSSDTPTPTVTPIPTATDEPLTPTDTPTLTPVPTDVPTPTDTPTLTPVPTDVPTPTDTPTLTPVPTDVPTPTDKSTPSPTPLPCTTGSSYCLTTQPTSMCLATGGQVELDVTAPVGSNYNNANYIPNVGGTDLTFNGTVNTPLTIPIPATSNQSISIGVFFDTLGVSDSITLSNDPSACVTPTPTATPTVTPIPTVTVAPLTPTDTLTPTATPGPVQIGLSFGILLDGIGAAGDQVNPQANSLSNKNPSTTVISPKVFVYNSSSAITPISTTTQNFTYNQTTEKYEGVASLGAAETPTGQYVIKILVNKYLRKSFPGIISLDDNATGNISLPDITLISGDVDGDNALTINDYSTILDCMNSGPSCTTGIAAQADLNEDGVVDDKDLNLFLREYSIEKGD